MEKNLEMQTSLLEDSLANPGVSQENSEEIQMTVISGTKWLGLLKTYDLDGSLGKMCEALLTCQWASKEASLTWRVSDTKPHHLLFQLAPQMPNTDENDVGLWATPNTMDHLPQRSEEATIRMMNGHRKGRSKPSNLREQVDENTMKMWPTPTTMDSKEDSLKHATKLIQGKTHRASGQPIQKTLSDKVMMEEIKANPKLMEQYKDYEMVTRKNLPNQQEFVEYMRQQTTIGKLFKKTKIKKTTIEHWFRRDKAGFSHPSIEDWEKIKPHLKEIKYDQEMTTIHSIEWKKETTKMWPTPKATDYFPGMGDYVEENQSGYTVTRKGTGTKFGAKLSDAVDFKEKQEKQMMWPTPTATPRGAHTGKMSGSVSEDGKTSIRGNGTKFGATLQTAVAMAEKKKREMYPTPTARDYKDSGENLDLYRSKRQDTQLGVIVKRMSEIDDSKSDQDQSGGSLNPEWVEWLMGYPIGHTE